MWKLQQTDAVYEVEQSQGTAHARLNLKKPQLGLTEVTWNRERLGCQLLQLELPGAVASGNESVGDAYLREPDLIVTYESSEVRDVRPQIYWRDLTQGGACPLAIELWISVETGLLASHPATGVASCFGGKDLWMGRAHEEHLQPLRVGAGEKQAWAADDSPHFLLFRFDQQPVTYVEMIYPSDSAGAEVRGESDGSCRWRFNMFPTSLEKGVIRRARIRGYLLPREGDEREARRLLADFLETTPPLTA